MSDEKVPYLCGGVLFSLLKQAAQSSASSKDHLNGTSDSHSYLRMLEDFITALRIDDALEGESQHKTELTTKVVSKYINCKENVTKSLPFTKAAFVSTYDGMVKTQYAKAMEKMKTFILLHLDPNYYEWLMKRILYVIDWDPDIANSDQFFIAGDGMPKTKEEIKTMNDFCLPAVLVGVMHYILLFRSKDNTEGKATLDRWGPQEPHCQREFNRDAILGVDRDIHMTLECPLSASDIGVQNSERREVVQNNKEDYQPYLEIANPQIGGDEESPVHKKCSEPAPCIVVQESRMLEVIPENIKRPSKLDVVLYESFKTDSADFLTYIIEHDPAGEPIARLLPYNIKELIKTWKKRAAKIEDREMRETILLTLDLLSQYAYFISDEFLRVCEEQNFLIFRNQSVAERRKLEEVLQPKTTELRYALLRQYRKLYNMPEVVQDFFNIFEEEEEEPPVSGFQDLPLPEEKTVESTKTDAE